MAGGTRHNDFRVYELLAINDNQVCRPVASWRHVTEDSALNVTPGRRHSKQRFN